MHFKFNICCWSNNCFYGMFKFNNVHHLLTFNLETLKWLDIGILASYPKSLFVDSSGIITLHVGVHCKPNGFYRFALK